MSTYLGWNTVAIPAYPPAPASIDFVVVAITSGLVSPFTGQTQIIDWNASYMEGSVAMPPMNYANGQNWLAFFRALDGMANVFQFSSAFMAAYPNDLGTRYWRLKANSLRYAISPDRYYRFQFEIREAK